MLVSHKSSSTDTNRIIHLRSLFKRQSCSIDSHLLSVNHCSFVEHIMLTMTDGYKTGVKECKNKLLTNQFKTILIAASILSMVAIVVITSP